MTVVFHVSSSRNRESISEHGLDWTRMSGVRGIAGSDRPEVHGVFVCTDESTVDWFVRLNNTGGPVDVWAFKCADADELVDGGSGYAYLPRRVPPDALRLVQRDLPPEVAPKSVTTPGGAYRSILTVTLTDGTVLTDGEAHAHIRDVSCE